MGLNLERLNVAEAECVPVHEGSMCTVAMRDGDAPSGSKARSRMEGNHRNMRGPTGAARLVSGGGNGEGNPKPSSELRSGVGQVHSVRWAARESWGLKSPRRSDEERCIRRRG